MTDFSYFIEALDEVFETELDNYVNDLEIDEHHEFSEKYNKKIEKLIKRQRKPYFMLICTTGRRVACIIATVVLISASAMSVKAVRQVVCDFIMKIFSNHTEISVDTDSDDYYPTTIEDEYFISNLPEGFEQTDYNKTDNSITITYFNDDTYIFFNQYTKDAFVSDFDNEHSKIELYTDDNGQEYLIHNTGYDYTFVWDNGDCIFELSSNLDKDIVLDLCTSTKIK